MSSKQVLVYSRVIVFDASDDDRHHHHHLYWRWR